MSRTTKHIPISYSDEYGAWLLKHFSETGRPSMASSLEQENIYETTQKVHRRVRRSDIYIRTNHDGGSENLDERR